MLEYVTNELSHVNNSVLLVFKVENMQKVNLEDKHTGLDSNQPRLDHR